MHQADSADIIARAQSGNAKAAGELYELHYQSVFRYLYYRVGDQLVAEDLTSEVFLKMIQALPGFRPGPALFRGWLLQIARNLAIDHFRRKAAHPIEPIQEDITSGEKVVEIVERGLNSLLLRESLSQLNEEQRDVILLRFIEGFSIHQTAATLHKSEDAIKGLQRRALMSLREVLNITEG